MFSSEYNPLLFGDWADQLYFSTAIARLCNCFD